MRWMLAVLVLVVASCGPDEERPLAQGWTPCNDAPDPTSGVVCSPNQYCASQQHNWCYIYGFLHKRIMKAITGRRQTSSMKCKLYYSYYVHNL